MIAPIGNLLPGGSPLDAALFSILISRGSYCVQKRLAETGRFAVAESGCMMMRCGDDHHLVGQLDDVDGLGDLGHSRAYPLPPPPLAPPFTRWGKACGDLHVLPGKVSGPMPDTFWRPLAAARRMARPSTRGRRRTASTPARGCCRRWVAKACTRCRSRAPRSCRRQTRPARRSGWKNRTNRARRPPTRGRSVIRRLRAATRRVVTIEPIHSTRIGPRPFEAKLRRAIRDVFEIYRRGSLCV